MNVLYLAHDLDDTAIWRRVAMLRAGGARLRVAGFRRGDAPLTEEAELLGQTENGRLVARAASVARLLPSIGRRVARMTAGDAPDVILARNLEMLMLARVAMLSLRKRPKLVYEMLDIHRAMLGQGAASRMMRRIEARLMRDVAQLWISSDGFRAPYLDAYDRPVRKLVLVENKMLRLESEVSAPGPATRSAPAEPGRITIGWFGILRCAWSLETLDALTRADPGRYRVILRGKPARDAMPDFDRIVAANPDLNFEGAYRWPDDLAAIYGECDFAWLIDRFDAGANSDWLVPNRLYEGCLHGAVPIALAGTQVGKYLDALGCGVLVPEAHGDAVRARLAVIGAPEVAEARAAVAALPRELWEADTDACRRLVDVLREPSDTEAQPAAFRERRSAMPGERSGT
ncbi:glycosyltransferase [Salipiger abyssi]|uniref:glycosyltransferase n=1 Tax=Salipiger abyssi TaxID=1250539 RepID=UPI001A8E301A|nr:glycosyltransferase [Salipiger abyssi]MBN9886274.1 glycosyl transferase [Salipiger abyssi]